MSDGGPDEPSAWPDAALAAALFAIDPAAMGGVALRALAGPVRERWLELLRALLPAGAPVRRIPLHVGEDRLLGGLDLAATLRAGRPVAERGILAAADGGVVMLAMAERLASATAAQIGAALDLGEVRLERDGLARRELSRIGVVALDEGIAADERPPAALLDRLAFQLDLGRVGIRDAGDAAGDASAVEMARARLATVTASDEVLEALCAAALVLGIPSLRASLLALAVARAAAALAGRDEVGEADVAIAGRLVLAPRATRLPAPEEDVPEGPPDRQEDRDQEEAAGESDRTDQTLEDLVVAAAQAALPQGLLDGLQLGGGSAGRARSTGRAGAMQQALRRGRPSGVRRGLPRGGHRLNLIETLRAAAPWQTLRRSMRSDAPPRVEVRQDDFRITRLKQHRRTTMIFAVDASGSAALHRLAEAKGAVELLLAECYVRRDRVALIAFRGQGAELLLPPTRSLVRAKRSLAGLPGGGGTPLAAGIHAALMLADLVQRSGDTPVLVVLTDGRANIARDGTSARPRAEEEALAVATQVRVAGVSALLIDTAPRAQPQAGRLAAQMGARYLPLPHADAAALSQAVRRAATTADSRSPGPG